MMFCAAFNNISIISWRSVLLVEDPDKTTDSSQVTDRLYLIMYQVHLEMILMEPDPIVDIKHVLKHSVCVCMCALCWICWY